MNQVARLVIVALSITLTKQAVAKPSPAQRVRALLRSMTIEEKVGQLNQFSAGEPTGPGTQRSSYEAMIAAGQVGSLLNVTDPKQVNSFQRIAVEESPNRIPLLFGFDVIHGFRTIFPINLGLAATWDPDLVEKVARLSAEEASAHGVRWTFAPMVDIARDARWGRISESSGEDPYLASLFARAYVRGYQGARLDEPTAILACAKHFVGYGAAEAGRDYNTTEISEGTLRRIYLPPFKAAAEAGVATVMTAFNSLNGVPATSNAFTLQDVLRQEWKFRGFVVSDWGAVAETIAHGIADDAKVAARKAFIAGVDMDMESGLFLSELPTLVRSGAVPMGKLDAAVARILHAKIALGLFDAPYVPVAEPPRPLPAASLALARTAAEKSFVLLKNQPFRGAPILPMTLRRGSTVALIGAHADSSADMLGSWSGRGSPADVTTLRVALEARARASGVTLLYTSGSATTSEAARRTAVTRAVELAKRADTIVVALGEPADFTGEAASRAHLDLGEPQQSLLQSIADTGKPVVLVLFAGRPLTITWAAENVSAIVMAWFPGVEAGPALVRLLLGEIDAAGRLTATFPRTVGQEPLYYNALPTGRPLNSGVGVTWKPYPVGPDRFKSRYIDESNTPLFPFGHGLSYTTFEYSTVEVHPDVIPVKALRAGRHAITASVTVTNTGKREGTTVAQCYIRLTGTSVSLPIRELRGMQRLSLLPGERRRVEFVLTRDALALSTNVLQRTTEPATLQVWISPDSAQGLPTQVKLMP